jgi:hypothetical protein
MFTFTPAEMASGWQLLHTVQGKGTGCNQTACAEGAIMHSGRPGLCWRTMHGHPAYKQGKFLSQGLQANKQCGVACRRHPSRKERRQRAAEGVGQPGCSRRLGP